MSDLKNQIPEALLRASQLLLSNQADEAKKLLSVFNAQDDISKICLESLLAGEKSNDHIYLSRLTEKDKQINMFDLVLNSVDSVRIASRVSLSLMKDFYTQGQKSFAHLNVGIGKGHFEVQLLKELSEVPTEKIPSTIKIFGVDIDEFSLEETGENILKAAREYLPEVKVEYFPISSFAETISPVLWNHIKNHGTDLLGVVSAFTLHHIASDEKRMLVLNRIAECNPGLFLQIEPDVNHYTPNIAERLINCWNHFGTLFKLIDKKNLRKEEAEAIKYVFFKREISDILSVDENARFEKHEEAEAWISRFKRVGMSLYDIPYYVTKEIGDLEYEQEEGIIRVKYQGVPMVAMLLGTMY